MQLNIAIRTGILSMVLIVPAFLQSVAQSLPGATRNAGVTEEDDSSTPDPNTPGWSLAVANTASHDSQSGWSVQQSPSTAYRLNRVLSFDATQPFFAFMQAVRTGKQSNATLTNHTLVLGDTVVASHFAFSPERLGYVGTVAVSFPTGDQSLGVGAGHVGYDVNNHVEHEFGIFTPQLELGIGNTSNLLRRRTVKSYTSSGELLFAQVGLGLSLPRGFSVDSEAYEQLPVGNQTVYSRRVRKSGALLNAASSAEDNGFSVEVDAPAVHRLLLGASFTRSLRLGESTESLLVSYVIRSPVK